MGLTLVTRESFTSHGQANPNNRTARNKPQTPSRPTASNRSLLDSFASANRNSSTRNTPSSSGSRTMTNAGRSTSRTTR